MPPTQVLIARRDPQLVDDCAQVGMGIIIPKLVIWNHNVLLGALLVPYIVFTQPLSSMQLANLLNDAF